MKNHSISLTVRGRRFVERIAGFLEYLLMLIVLLECNSMYTSAVETVGYVDMYLVFYRAAILLTGAAIALRLYLNQKALRKLLPYVIVVVALLIWTTAFYFLNVRGLSAWKRLNYRFNFLIFLPLLAVLFKVKQQSNNGFDLLYKFSDISCILGLLSLIVFLSSVFRPDSVPSDVVYTRWNDLGVTSAQINLLDVCQSVSGARWSVFGVSLLRDRGPFNEPLMFALPLVVSLFTELFIRDAGRFWRILRSALLSAVLVAVNATIGLMLMALAWCVKGIAICLDRQKRRLVLPIILIAVCACGLLWLEKGKTSYEETEVSGNSLSMHVEDYQISLKAFMNRPLLGGGYHSENYIRTFMREYRLKNNRGLSNSAGVILAEGGLMLGSLCMLPFAIWFLFFFRRRDRRIAYWAVGALGAYIGIIFKYHLLLLCLIALGYSMLEIEPVKSRRFSIRLSLIDASEQINPPARIENREKKRLTALMATALIILACVILVICGAPFWQTIHTFLRSHQLSIGQSPLRSFCFATALLVHGISLHRVVRRELSYVRIMIILLWDVVYLLIWPWLFSSFNTLMSLWGMWGELRDCALLLAVWLVPVLAGLFVTPNKWLNRKGATVAGSFAVMIFVLILFARGQIDRFIEPEDPLIPVLEDLTACASGKVFVNDLPSLYRQSVKGISLAATRDMGYDVFDNATIVFRDGSERRELSEEGFEVAELTDGYIAYSNDIQAIQTLSEKGFVFYRYYPFAREIDLKYMARRNRLSTKEDGSILVEGPEKSMISGPYETLHPGQYTLTYSLHIDPSQMANLIPDTRICDLAVSWNYGEETIAEQSVTLAAFDEEGNAAVEFPFKISRITDAVEYKLYGILDVSIELSDLSIRQTPDFTTITTYNSHRDAIREDYYNPDGTPYLKSDRYASLEREYDLANHITAIRYFDSEGQPVMLKNGYAEVDYGYNRKGTIVHEAFYDTEGSLTLIKAGYAVRKREVDAYGNVISIRYLGTDEAPIDNTYGYAEVRRTYDSKRQIIREEYFSAGGNRVALSTGQAIEERDYDEVGNIISRRYYDVDGAPIVTSMGYAELRQTYDFNGEVAFEEYFGADGSPLLQSGGYCGIEQGYDEEGNLSYRLFLDANGDPTLRVEGYSEMRWQYDDSLNEHYVTFHDLNGNQVDFKGINLVTDASSEWSEWFYPIENAEYTYFNLATISLPDKQAGDLYTCRLEIEFRGVTSTEGQPFRIYTQGAVDGKWGMDNFWNSSILDLKTVPNDGVYQFSATNAISEKSKNSSLFNLGIRCNYWNSGAFRVRCVSVEVGSGT